MLVLFLQAMANLYTQEREKGNKDFVINFWRGGKPDSIRVIASSKLRESI